MFDDILAFARFSRFTTSTAKEHEICSDILPGVVNIIIILIILIVIATSYILVDPSL
jgi:hypothetical protein